MSMEFYSAGRICLRAFSTETPSPAPFQHEYGATFQCSVGMDRLAVATTLVEIAANMLNDAPHIQSFLKTATAGMILEQMKAADKFVVRLPEDSPF